MSPPQAHFFALYFAVLGFMTPPVAPAVLVASPLASSPFLRSSLQSLKLVAPVYLLPFFFCYNPALLGQFTSGLWSGLLAVVVALLVVVSLPTVLYGYYLVDLNWPGRVLALVSTIGFSSYFFTRSDILGVIVGAACFILLTLWQLRKRRTIKVEL